jgi:hypothetical protein
LHSQQALEPCPQDSPEREYIRDLAALDHRLEFGNLDPAHRRDALTQLRRADLVDAAKEQRNCAADERGSWTTQDRCPQAPQAQQQQQKRTNDVLQTADIFTRYEQRQATLRMNTRFSTYSHFTFVARPAVFQRH